VWADCRDECGEDDDEGSDEDVEADAFRAVRFHTYMVHPTATLVNPHRKNRQQKKSPIDSLPIPC
jgi:hypothetical protein